MKHLICPFCGYKWHYSFWEWILKAPFHWFDWRKWKDLRYTKCPACGTKSWVYRQ